MSFSPDHPNVQLEQPISESDDRRWDQRGGARVKVRVFRGCDVWRQGVPAQLVDVSVSGLGLLIVGDSPAVGEPLTITLKNEVQRFEKEVRGVVQYVAPADGGHFRLGIKLLTRLMPLEAGFLRSARNSRLSEPGPVWV